MIKTWNERCENHPDHQTGMVSHAMIQARMQEEIDELRAALATVPSDCPDSHQLSPKPVCDECGKSKTEGWALYCVDCMKPVFDQRKPLTDEAVQQLYAACCPALYHFKGFGGGNFKWLVRVIEQAHGIGSKDE